MSSESDARRIASGPPPSQLVRAQKDPQSAVRPEDGQPTAPSKTQEPPFDPLRLCIFATIALLGWLAGPLALIAFSAVGIAGYWKARRAGLKKSKCCLRDTRLVLAYLGTLTVAGLSGTYAIAAHLLGR